ncbi:efflux RND transporter periplasmic adaptor subunit [uncultured Aquitalea sp.]|uniref:HlyD family secretion protein n=1 Tax=uncultured Aquitalea sp. TaxID=540272 RepID=UPI0025FC7909|nr:efflux RND transporter periplasmic adaptor subunit [uncultured Aquitalea sp.]
MKKTGWIVAALVLGVAGAVGYSQWQNRARGLPDGLIQANGRLEGDSVLIAGKYPGRLAEVRAHEGDAVTSGQVVAVLASDEVTARLHAAQAAVASARAQKDRAAAASAQAGKDAARFADLLARGSVDRMHAEQMQLAAVSARTVLQQADQQISQADAARREAQAVLDELTLKAPSGGVVVNRLREPGEVVAAGAGVVELVDLNKLYLKVYVPENQIGKVRLGLPAQLHTDAFPDQVFEARVTHIGSKAEFTPKEVQTPDERVKLVYAVKLSLSANPGFRLTPGLPADAVIRWKDDVPWQAPHW